MNNLGSFATVAQFSSGMFGGTGAVANAPSAVSPDVIVPAILKNAAANQRQLKLLYMSCGAEDPAAEVPARNGGDAQGKWYAPVWMEFKGAHQWKVWRSTQQPGTTALPLIATSRKEQKAEPRERPRLRVGSTTSAVAERREPPPPPKPPELVFGRAWSHGQRAAAELVVVELLNGSLGFLVGGHLHEREAAPAAGGHVGHHVHALNRARIGEQRLKT